MAKKTSVDTPPPSRRSISSDLLISLALTFTLVSVLGVSLNAWYLSDRAQQHFETKHQEYLTFLQNSLSEPMWNYNDEQINTICRFFLNTRQVAALTVKDSFGNSLFRSSTPTDTHSVLKILPITYHYENIGSIELWLSSQVYLQQTRNIIISSVIVLLAVLFFLLLVMSVLLHFYFRIPLQSLIQRLDEIANANYQSDKNTLKQREIHAILARANHMAEQIQHREQALQSMNVTLQKEIEERRVIEQALLQHQEHLEIVVAERTRDLQTAKELAEASNRAKSAFIANMNHELRTPLNTILGFAQILNADPNLAEKHRRSVRNIRNGGDYLLTLINDILDLAKIEAGRFELFPEAWQTGLFFHEISEMFHVRTEQKGIFFEYQSDANLPAVLYSDSKRLRQIMMNLLGNAVKFTEQGGITLRSRYIDNHLHVEVEDTGIGISHTELERIFQPFTQVGDVAYRQQGTGLGLSITQRLVASMDGLLTVRSELGQGSLFCLTIPAEAISTLSEAKNRWQGPIVTSYQRKDSDEPLHILITDDLADNRAILRQLLEPIGFVISEVENGAQCLKFVEIHPVNAVLMDLRMPILDGLQATEILRKTPRFINLPIIMISASSFGNDQQLALQKGCNAYLQKPVVLHELLAELARYLPLTWRYQSDAEHTARHAPSLSEEERQKLHAMLLQGDISGIYDYLTPLAKQADCPADIKALWELAEIFDLDGLSKVLEG